MSALWLLLVAVALIGFSGLPACFGSCRSANWQRATTALLATGCALGAGVAIFQLQLSGEELLALPVSLPVGRLLVGIDALGAVFLLPVFIVPLLGSVYGLGYWKQAEHPASGRRLGLFYGLLTASMAGVVLARDAALFIVAWEMMALSAFFLITAEDDDQAVRKAGWIYLIATHVGTLCLIAMFALWREATGSLDLLAAGALPSSLASAVFVLALVGFGFKAGIMPLHVWLPGAHANAPSHVSAVLSGVMLKMGIYGIARMTSLLPAPPTWWGGLLLGLGAATAVLGIAFASAQRDFKRLLAYSSIENMGIILLGLGLALLGRAHQVEDWVALGMGGALLHVWNHALFKPLLFLNAGAILHAAHTREIDRLGGLARQMPRTALLFATGAVAICALPPLNGFASECLLYLGMFRAAGAGCPAIGLGVAALALTGALALACFVKLYGTVFLGEARTKIDTREPGAILLIPMAVLAAGCCVLGIMPWLALRPLGLAVEAWGGSAGALPEAAPLSAIGLASAALAAAALLGFVFIRWLLRKSPAAGTWDCGYVRVTPRVQYTGSSFAQMIGTLFSWALWPVIHLPGVQGIFPKPAHYHGEAPDTVLERGAIPLLTLLAGGMKRLRLFQQGKINIYIIYILAVVLGLLFCEATGIY
jgi:hydrogenase-4 component B